MPIIDSFRLDSTLYFLPTSTRSAACVANRLLRSDGAPRRRARGRIVVRSGRRSSTRPTTTLERRLAARRNDLRKLAYSDALSKVVPYSRDDDRSAKVELPGKGSRVVFGGRMDAKETFFSFSKLRPRVEVCTVFDVRRGEPLWLRPECPLMSTPYVTEQVFCESKDRNTRLDSDHSAATRSSP